MSTLAPLTAKFSTYLLKVLVSDKGAPELGTAPDDTGRATFPESPEAFFSIWTGVKLTHAKSAGERGWTGQMQCSILRTYKFCQRRPKPPCNAIGPSWPRSGDVSSRHLKGIISIAAHQQVICAHQREWSGRLPAYR